MAERKDLSAILHYLVPTILGNALPLILLPFLTRALSPADFGLIALTQALGMLVFGLINFGLPVAYERNYFHYRQDPAGLAGLTWSCFGFLLIAGIFAAIFIHFLGEPLDELFFHSVTPAFAIFLSVLAVNLRGANELVYRYLRNAELPKVFAVISVIETTVGFLLTIALVIVSAGGVRAVFIAQVCASVAATLMLMFFLSRRLTPTFDWIPLRETLRLGAPLAPRAILGVLASQLDKYLISIIGSLSGVGVYSIGQRIGQVVFLIMNAFDYVFIPKIYNLMFNSKTAPTSESLEATQREIGSYLTPFIFATALLCLGVGLFSEEVLSLLASRDFHGAIEIAAVLSLANGAAFFGKVNGRQILFAKKSFLTLALSFASIAVTATVSIPLIRTFGALGAAFSALAVAIVTGGLAQWQAQKCYRIRWEYRAISWMIVALIAAIAFHLGALMIGIAWAPRFAFKLLLVIGWLAVGWKCGYLRLNGATGVELEAPAAKR